jgi:hypothetical protein
MVAEKNVTKKCAYMFNMYKDQLSRQTGSRNLTGPKNATHNIRGLYCFTSVLPSVQDIFFVAFFSVTVDGRNLILWVAFFGPVRFLLPVTMRPYTGLYNSYQLPLAFG